jgi:hypothetical protein
LRLQISQWITPGIQNIPFDIHPESHEKINDQRRPHRQEGYVNKIFTDSTRSDAHFFANGGANTEYMPFYKLFEAVHSANVNKFSENYRLFLSNFKRCQLSVVSNFQFEFPHFLTIS